VSGVDTRTREMLVWCIEAEVEPAIEPKQRS